MAEDIGIDVGEDFVATVEIRRPPNNHFDTDLIRQLALHLERLDRDPRCRVVLLCSEGKHFCAGADFGGGSGAGDRSNIYDEGIRLFRTQNPIVAAVQGAAVGGGLGLALVADFRVASPDSRLAANFARLGYHHGFGLGVTLPAAVGQQRALDLLFSGRRVPGEEALRIGLCDRLAPSDRLRQESRALAAELAISAPLAVRAIRATMRAGLAERVYAAMQHEGEEQARLRQTDDFREGVKAMAERREPRFSRA